MKKKLKQKVGVAYIRESTEDQDKGFSPQNQERSIKDYAKKHNITISECYKDLVSGRYADKREDFQRMIEDAMQKKFEVVLVYHTSRFARNVQEARQYKDLLRNKQKIDVLSVTQQFGEFDRPDSFLNEGINELFDEYYSKQLSFWVRSSLMEKRRQGKPIGGSPPYGYYKKKIGYDKEKKRIIYDKNWLVNKKEAGIVKRIFKDYSSGNYSMSEIATKLTKEGHKTRYGNPFGYSSIKCMLRNKTYLGLVWSPRKNLPELKSTIHKPIISEDLFLTCQEVADKRSKSCGRPVAQFRFYLLQGLVYCYHCKKKLDKKSEQSAIRRMQPSMYCETHKWETGEKYFYACKFKKENNCCKGKTSECKIIDSQVIDFMEGFNLPEQVINRTVEKLKEKLGESKEDNKENNRVANLKKKKKKLKFLFYETEDMTQDEYLLEKQKIDSEIKSIERHKNKNTLTEKNKKRIARATKKFLEDFSEFWNLEIGKEERRQWILQTIDKVWVKNDKVVAIEPKNDYRELFDIHKKVISQGPLVAHYKTW